MKIQNSQKIFPSFVLTKRLFQLTFYENNRVQPYSFAMLNKLIDTKNFFDFLDLVESYSRSMPFIDHDEFTNSLAKAWTLYSDR